MAKPGREAIDTLISVTGLSETDAIRKLEEHSGNLDEAVDAHFSEGERNINRGASFSATRDDDMEIDDTIPANFHRPPSLLSPPFPRPSLLSQSFAGSFNPISLLDPNFMRSFFDTGPDFATRSPFVSHPSEVREIPIDFRDGFGRSGQYGSAPIIEEVTDTTDGLGPEVRGTVIYDDEDEDDYTSNAPLTQTGPSIPSVDMPDDVEEAMIRAAIEASKQDAAISNESYDGHLDLRVPASRPGQQSQVEDAEIAHAVSLSLQTAEREKTLKERRGVEASESENLKPAPSRRELPSSYGRSSLLEVGNPTIQEEIEDVEEMPLLRHRRRRVTRTPTNQREDTEEVEVIPPSSPQQHSQPVGSHLPADEWGGISSAEHDEAVMLEAAMFGGIPEESRYYFPYTPHQLMQQNGLDRGVGPRRMPRPPSPSVTRLIREQQDDEYLAALQADKEKEVRAMEEAEAALAEERRKEEEIRRKVEEEQEIEKQIAEKEASLPQEPTDGENAVNLLVRMPDGSRRGRRFLKSDKLQILFDFIDVGRGVKPGSYRLVRPYPRRAFSVGESTSTLNELGLTSKQEALYLELI